MDHRLVDCRGVNLDSSARCATPSSPPLFRRRAANIIFSVVPSVATSLFSTDGPAHGDCCRFDRGVRLLFGDYMSRVIHLGPQSSAIWAALVVAILTAVNYVGIREGKLTQNFFTFLECGGLVLIVVARWILLAPQVPVVARRATFSRRDGEVRYEARAWR